MTSSMPFRCLNTHCASILYLLLNVIALITFQQVILREMSVNISNEFNFSDVHGVMNHSVPLAKLT